MRQSHEAAANDRERIVNDRERLADQRERLADEREGRSDRRDREVSHIIDAADLRDSAASLRDQTARLRDEAANEPSSPDDAVLAPVQTPAADPRRQGQKRHLTYWRGVPSRRTIRRRRQKKAVITSVERMFPDI